jgi:hypothetical protein
MKFKSLECVNPDGKTMTIYINVLAGEVLFLSKAEIPTNIKGTDGELKTVAGTTIAFKNGVVLMTKMSVDDAIKFMRA